MILQRALKSTVKDWLAKETIRYGVHWEYSENPFEIKLCRYDAKPQNACSWGERNYEDEYGTKNSCSMVVKIQSAKEALKKPNTINSEGICNHYTRILKETAHRIHIQQKRSIRNVLKWGEYCIRQELQSQKKFPTLS